MRYVDDQHWEVLDQGYARLIDSMGSDLEIANDARTSFMKRAETLGPTELKLIRFLASRHETSPFRHSVLKFEVYAPLLVARQWWKYAVGSSHHEEYGDNGVPWNESSRRYVTEEPVFYIPAANQWRSAPANKKQGSGDVIPESVYTRSLTTDLQQAFEEAVELYHEMLYGGVAPEQARLVLPAYAMYVRWRWTASLQAVSWFLTERLAHKAQWELNQYAQVIYHLTKPVFPIALDELLRANGLEQTVIEEIAASGV